MITFTNAPLFDCTIPLDLRYIYNLLRISYLPWPERLVPLTSISHALDTSCIDGVATFSSITNRIIGERCHFQHRYLPSSILYSIGEMDFGLASVLLLI